CLGRVRIPAVWGDGHMQEMWAWVRLQPLLLPLMWTKTGLKKSWISASQEIPRGLILSTIHDASVKRWKPRGLSWWGLSDCNKFLLLYDNVASSGGYAL